MAVAGLRGRSGRNLKNARQGYSVKPTWSAFLSPISLLPLDHFLLSPEIAVSNFRLGPNIDSDHRKLIVELSVPAPSS